MVVKILHTADNHLDPRATLYRHKIDERRKDFWKAFEKVLKYAEVHKPDIFLIAGDLYDRVNPRNPPRALLMKYFRHLHDLGIRTFVIGGHHDTPRSVEEGASPIEELAAAGYVTFFRSIREADAEVLKVSDLEVCVSGITYNFSLRPGEDPLSRVRVPLEGDVNILMLHHTIEGFTPTFRQEEPVVRVESIPKGLHYVAAGHIHRHQKRSIGSTVIAYSGSTERKSFSEEGDEEKGFLWVEIDEEGVKGVRFISVPTRPMKTADYTLTKGVRDPVGEIVRFALKYADKDLIMRLRIKGKVPLEVLSKYRRDEILRRLLDKFFAIVIDDEALEYMPITIISSIERLSPLKAFISYMDELIEKEEDDKRKKVLEKAKELGSRIIEEEGGW